MHHMLRLNFQAYIEIAAVSHVATFTWLWLERGTLIALACLYLLLSSFLSSGTHREGPA